MLGLTEIQKKYPPIWGYRCQSNISCIPFFIIYTNTCIIINNGVADPYQKTKSLTSKYCSAILTWVLSNLTLANNPIVSMPFSIRGAINSYIVWHYIEISLHTCNVQYPAVPSDETQCESRRRENLSLSCKHKVSLVQSILYPVKSFKEEWLYGHLVHNILLLSWSHIRMQWQLVRWELIHVILLQSLVEVSNEWKDFIGFIASIPNCHML